MKEIKNIPQNIEVEKSLLGCMLMDKDAIITVSAWLRPEHFFDGKHITIYSAIMDLFNNALPVDLVTVVDKLKKQNEELVSEIKKLKDHL